MRIRSVQITNFRGIRELTVDLHEGLTTIVGENGVGKTSFALALRALVEGLAHDAVVIQDSDRHAGSDGPVTVRATIELSADELAEMVVGPAFGWDGPLSELDERWAVSLGRTIVGVLVRGRESYVGIEWGPLLLTQSWLGAPPELFDPPTRRDRDAVLAGLRARKPYRNRTDEHVRFANTSEAVTKFGQYLAQQFGMVEELRDARGDAGTSGEVESPTGADLAPVLRTLKNHWHASMRARYDEVVTVFSTLFPQHRIEAIDAEPGKPEARVQLVRTTDGRPIDLTQASLGMRQWLTLITGLVGRTGGTYIVEHPESALHPTAQRAVFQFLLDTVAKVDGQPARNDVILTTHSPHFVSPHDVLGLRRLARVGDTVQVHAPPGSAPDRAVERLRTALRRSQDRETLFARAALVVEGESELAFLEGVAETLGVNLGAEGAAIVESNGDNGHVPYVALFEAVAIPHVVYRDRRWGTAQEGRLGRYFSLNGDAETGLEDHLRAHGLGDRYDAVFTEVGRSKRRAAREIGQRLAKHEIPEPFPTVLNTVVQLARDGRVATPPT